MAQKTIDMIQAKQIQQLKSDGIPIKEIVRRTGISRKTVKKYLRKLEAACRRAANIEQATLTMIRNILQSWRDIPVCCNYLY